MRIRYTAYAGSVTNKPRPAARHYLADNEAWENIPSGLLVNVTDLLLRVFAFRYIAAILLSEKLAIRRNAKGSR